MDKNNCLELMNSLQNLVEEIMRKEVVERKKLDRLDSYSKQSIQQSMGRQNAILPHNYKGS